MANDEDALICDFAETYNIYDLKGLPVHTLAALATGLSENSRSKMSLAGRKATTEILMLGIIADRLGALVWIQSEDGHKGINRPKSIYEQLLKGNQKESYMEFDSPEAYEAARARARGE